MRNRIKVFSEELSGLQHTLNQRDKYDALEFRELADKGLSDLLNANAEMDRLSLGFLIAPASNSAQATSEGNADSFLIRETNTLEPNVTFDEVDGQRNHYRSVLGFEVVTVANGWLAGILFQKDPTSTKTLYVPHKSKIELIASGSTADGTLVSYTDRRRVA